MRCTATEQFCVQGRANWPISKPKAYSRYWEASSSPPIPRWTSSLSIGGISSTDSSKSSSRLIPFLNQYSWNHYISLIGLFLRCWYCKLWQEHFVLPCANDPQLNNNNNSNNKFTQRQQTQRTSAQLFSHFGAYLLSQDDLIFLQIYKYHLQFQQELEKSTLIHFNPFCHSDRGPWAACNRSQEQNNTIQL